MTLPPSWAFCIDVGGERAGTVTGQMNMVGAFGAFATGLAFPYLYSAFNSVTPFFLTAVALNLAGAMLWVRSEEHTSELQSLMRISYAVFCLTKKIIYHLQS